jgi:hypothetical protein
MLASAVLLVAAVLVAASFSNLPSLQLRFPERAAPPKTETPPAVTGLEQMAGLENALLLRYLDSSGLLHELRIPSQSLRDLLENLPEGTLENLVRACLENTPDSAIENRLLSPEKRSGAVGRAVRGGLENLPEAFEECARENAGGGSIENVAESALRASIGRCLENRPWEADGEARSALENVPTGEVAEAVEEALRDAVARRLTEAVWEQAGRSFGNAISQQAREHASAGEALRSSVLPPRDLPHLPLVSTTGTGTPFLRRWVGEVYENGRWRMRGDSVIGDYGGETLPRDIGGYSSLRHWTAQITPLRPVEGFVPLPDHVERVEGLSGVQCVSPQQCFYSPSPVTGPYWANYSIPSWEESTLRSARADTSDPTYLRLPPTVSGRVRQLVENITGTPWERAEAIREYLRRNCTLGEHVEPPRGVDPTEWFLFEARRGDSADFNSAFAVLARCSGVPCRVEFGYEVDPERGGTVYEDEIFGRTELRLENLGWVPFDAAPPHVGRYQDRDADGMPDWWEERYGLNPDANDAAGDADGDGSTNLEEYRAGTDPRDPRSRPWVPIPTETEVVQVQENCLRGGSFTVVGRVTDKRGGVGGMRVSVYLKKNKTDNAPEAGVGETDENGWFSVVCRVGKEVQVGEYWVVARSWGTSTHAGSWSDPKLRVLSATSITLSTPTKAVVGLGLSVQGKLMDNLTGEGLASMDVRVVCGPSAQAARTDANGSFSARFSPSAPENYDVAAAFPGSAYYLPSEARGRVEVVRPYILPSGDNLLVRGDRARVEGEVPIGGLTVRVSLGGVSSTCVSREDGSFRAEVEVPKSLPLGPATLKYSLEDPRAEAEKQVEICSRSALSVDAPLRARRGEKLNLTAALRDDTGAPIAAAKLTLRFENREIVAVTDTSGVASFSVSPRGEGTVSYSVHFGGMAYNLPAEARGSIEVVAPPRSLRPLLLIPLAAAPPVIFLVLRRRGRKRKLRSGEKAPPPREVEREGLKLSIEFPQIREPFPDVWEAGRPLRIAVRALGREPSKPRVVIDGRAEELRAEDGQWVTERAFEKGTHTISAEWGGLRAERQLRAVDYREEIAGLFNSLVAAYRERGAELGEDLAPREIQRRMEKVEGVDRRSLGEFLDIFEVANYSPHRVGRAEYERAYRCYLSLGGVA